MSASAIDIRPVETPRDRRTFVRLAGPLYADDPHYVAPLEFELMSRLDAAQNPGLKSSPHQLWTAWRNGAPVGRIAALVNNAYQDLYRDGAGHFGFIEGDNDPELFRALIETAGDWLRARGMKKIAGPFNFSVNEECGLLVDGFDAPPYFMMPHGRPYYAERLEALGFAKAMDMYAVRYIPTLQLIPEKRKRFVEKALAGPRVSIRNLNKKDMLGDIRTVVDVYNDAWSGNWGFVPFTEDHVRHMARELQPIIETYNVVICELNGEAVAFGLVLPNINRAIYDFNGKLFPFNWARLLWRLKIKGLNQARMVLMGVRKKLHGKPLGAALAYKIILMVNEANIVRGVTGSELSWVLETNEALLSILRDLGGEIYKTYRIYEKAL